MTNDVYMFALAHIFQEMFVELRGKVAHLLSEAARHLKESVEKKGDLRWSKMI